MKLLRQYRDSREARRLESDLEKRPGLAWSRLPSISAPLHDAGAVQIGSRLYIFAGYVSLSEVSDQVRVLDLENGTWLPDRAVPASLAHSHCAIASDGVRYIYYASGQFGPQCCPAIPDVWSYDTVSGHWNQLPPLPAARYAGSMQFWRGRLHFIGGAKQDRWTPSDCHWSLGVSEGAANEADWKPMTSIPVAGMHRGSILFNDQLFVFGGQQGDFVPVPGDPECRCDGHTQETYLADCFRLDQPDGDWVRLADMPVPVSHIDFSIAQYGSQILVLGGQAYKDPEDFYLRLTNAVQAYDPSKDRWSIAGHLPYPVKFPAAAVWNRSLFAVGGQRSRPATDTPGPVSSDTWKAEFPGVLDSSPKLDSHSVFAGKSILLVTHEVSLSGAPLLLLETAQMLIGAGATVRLASLGNDTAGWTLASEKQVPVIPVETATKHAASADYVVANTVSPAVMSWLKSQMSLQPGLKEKLVCWVHEIDCGHFLPAAAAMKDANLIIFDSDACRNAWVNKLGPLDQSVVIHPAVNSETMLKLSKSKQRFPDNPSQTNSDLAVVTRTEARTRLGLKDGDFLVLCIGLVERRKGQALLLKTLARRARTADLPIKLALVGFKNWKRRAKFLLQMPLADRRVLSPSRCYVRQSETASFYKAADAFVMNSQGMDGTGGECFGRVTIEAMAAGLVVLGTNSGGTAEIIEDGQSGFLFPAGIEGQAVLAERIEELVRNPSLAARLAEGGKDRVSSAFTEKLFFQKLQAAFEHSFGR